MLQQVGLFLNPVGQRRVDFQNLCAARFGRLYLADGTEQAADLLAQQPVDLLVIDLERFDRNFDLLALRELIAARGAGRTLLLCPFSTCGWLPELLPCGAVDYAIAPLDDGELGALIDAQLAGVHAPDPDVSAMLAARDRVQAALAGADDSVAVGERLCAAMCGHDGVIHAALFLMIGDDDLHLSAQQSVNGFNLVQILNRGDRLLQSPLRHVLPGLLAACSGELAMLDAAAKSGDPELALTLLDKGIEMMVGIPLAPLAEGGVRGALCLTYGTRQRFAAATIAHFDALGQLAAAALAMAQLRRENETLRARLHHLATVDPLTGTINRRHGEQLLDLEIRRARRYQLPIALIGFDIDRFKAVNDQFGHPVGDVALRTVAEAAQAELRGSDVLVRSGGEEFHIIAPHTSAIDALKMAEKIRAAVARTEIPGCDRLTISLGVAQVADQESADALMVRVSAALGRAKRAGRNCVELAML